MHRDEIEIVLSVLPTWQNASTQMKNAFEAQMKGRQYGYGPLTAAWCWYHAGWKDEACSLQIQITEDVRMCYDANCPGWPCVMCRHAGFITGAGDVA